MDLEPTGSNFVLTLQHAHVPAGSGIDWEFVPTLKS